MIYKIFMDGYSIFDSSVVLGYSSLPLLSPSLDISLEDAGSFEFTIPKENARYDEIAPLVNEFEVFENNDLIWFGRPIEIKTDFYNKKTVYCEGALAYFNDSVIRPQTYDSVLIHTLFKMAVDSHNSSVASNRRFEIGKIEIPNRYVYSVEIEYTKVKDFLVDTLLSFGGYFSFRKVNGQRIIDWKTSYKENINQPIQYGLNLLDMTKNINLQDLITSIIPLGDNNITIADANGGVDYIDTPLSKIYGRITSTLSFGGYTTPSDLLDAAKQWIEENSIENLSFECSAADLSPLNDEYTKFEVGSLVKVTSPPHGINVTLPITNISIDMSTATKQITIGASVNKNLSSSVR